jgi:hypothetical protein
VQGFIIKVCDGLLRGGLEKNRAANKSLPSPGSSRVPLEFDLGLGKQSSDKGNDTLEIGLSGHAINK